MLAGAILLSTGAGLLSTLKISSGASRWIPFQMLAGFGIGISTQTPAIAVQTFLKAEDVSIGVAIILFFQCFGPAVFITIAQTVLVASLDSGLRSKLPGVDAKEVINTGATLLKTLVPIADVGTLLEIYNHAVTRTYIVAASMAAASLIGVVGIGLNKIPNEETGQLTKGEERKEPSVETKNVGESAQPDTIEAAM